MKHLFYILIPAMFICCTRANQVSISEEDSVLVALLDKLDNCQQEDYETRYDLYDQISIQYEKHNLAELQMQYQQKMLVEAEKVAHKDKEHGYAMMAEAYQRIATTYFVEGILDSASCNAKRAYLLAPIDTLNFRVQTLLLLAQTSLMREDADSTLYYLQEAKHISQEVSNNDLYRITHAYALDLEDSTEQLLSILPTYIAESEIYSQAELTRLLMFQRADAKQWEKAYNAANCLIQLNDSISREETSANVARICALQHEQQMEHLKVEREMDRTRWLLITSIVIGLLLVACLVVLFYRKKLRIAHANELEAMKISEVAQLNEDAMRDENIKLHRLYYEHLYAIILPILNANRSKSGHINLAEESWILIEQNTDMVIPRFTFRLRKNHPTLTTEDIRFCCLLMMRVPNAVLADIYGIAPSSVAMRKQRMKRKLDSDVQDQSIESYLNQYLK